VTDAPVVAILLAGGTGSRMGRSKQFIDLLGKPALYYALRAFEESPSVSGIYAVGDSDRIGEVAREANVGKYSGTAEPGGERSLSTRNGLSLCAESEDAVVLVHDGSRCLVTPELVERVVQAALGGPDGVIPALPVSDTIKVVHNGSVLRTPDRSELYAAQTPQAFRLGLLRKVYAAPEDLLRSATDDASLVESAGGRVAVVMGEKTNIKLTTPEDLVLAEAILASRRSAHRGERRFGRSEARARAVTEKRGAAG
jgi:2-C-methyl-D-erythritol 4-phosphate cytidylyltransferase